MHRCSSFSISLLTLVIFCFLIVAILWVWGDTWFVLICTSLCLRGSILSGKWIEEVEEQPPAVSSKSAFNVQPELDGKGPDPPHLGAFQFLYPIMLPLKRYKKRRHQPVMLFFILDRASVWVFFFPNVVNGTMEKKTCLYFMSLGPLT